MAGRDEVGGQGGQPSGPESGRPLVGGLGPDWKIFQKHHLRLESQPTREHSG